MNAFLQITKDVYKAVDTAEIYSWARQNISLPNAYQERGPFLIERSKYLIEPFKAIKDLKTRTVVVAGAVQTGKTLLADISIPWFIVNRPGPIQFSQATDDMVKDHINNRLYLVMQNCKALKSILPVNDRDFTNTGIKFPHMTLYANGEKETAFQAKSIMFAVVDEVHLFTTPGRLDQALARTSAFDIKGTSKHLVVSQPGVLDDDFDKIFRRGTMEVWNVPCSNCNKYFEPVWRTQRNDGSYYGVLWDSNDLTKPSGSWDYNEVIKTIRYECEYCQHKHYDTLELKDKWNKEGKYISTNLKADPSVRSFRWNALIKNSWKDLSIQFLQATHLAHMGIVGEGSALTNFFQQKMCQPFDPGVMRFDTHLKTDVYDVNTDWPEEVARFLTIDVQRDHFWLVVRAWAADGRSKQLYFGKGIHDDVLRVITQFRIPLNSVFCDIGNTETYEDGTRSAVYEYVDNNSFTGLRGDHWHDDGFDWTIRNVKLKLFYSQPQYIPNTKKGTIWYNFSPGTVSDILKNLRDGNSHEFKCLDNAEYKKQMYAEKKLPVKDKFGQIVWRWKNPNQLPNHAWDCERMQLVATLIHPRIHVIPKMV